MRISTKIILGLTVVLLLIGTGSLFTYQATSRLQRLLVEELRATAQLEKFQVQLAQLYAAEITMLSEERLPDRREIEPLLQRLEENVGDMRPLPYIPVSQTLMRELQARARTLIEMERTIVEQDARGDTFDARQTATEAIQVREDCLELSRRLLVVYRSNIHDFEGHNAKLGQMLQDTAFKFTILSVLIALLLMVGGFSSLVAPLHRLVAVSEAIAQGNLEVRAQEDRPDEIGRLGHAFNVMVEKLHGRIAEIAEKSRVLEQAELETRRQLHLAQRVQKSIVPGEINLAGVEVSGRIHAASFVGGDFYDVLVLDDRGQRLGLVVGDASGSGVPAALLMILTLSVFREASRQGGGPSQVMARVNRTIREHFPDGVGEAYVTAAYVEVDLDGMMARYTCAGHEPPLLYRARSGRVEPLECTGFFLVSFEDGAYTEGETPLEEGDKILLCTDGLTETRNREGEFFGSEGLEKLLEALGWLSCRELVDRIKIEVDAFRGDPNPRDDIALLVVEICPRRGLGGRERK